MSCAKLGESACVEYGAYDLVDVIIARGKDSVDFDDAVDVVGGFRYAVKICDKRTGFPDRRSIILANDIDERRGGRDAVPLFRRQLRYRTFPQ